jgi:hypothetical protein
VARSRRSLASYGKIDVLDPAQARAKNGERSSFASERRPAVGVRTDEVIESAPPFATHGSAFSGIAACSFLGCALPRIFLAPGRGLSLEPGARTARRGRTKAPERIWLLSRGARLSRGCPHFLLLCFFLRLLSSAALCDHGRWLVQGPSRKRFRWAGRDPWRICIIFHDRLGWRLISGEPGIRSNGWLHQPKKNEEKGRVGSNGDPGGSDQAAILVSRGARPKRIATKIHPRPPSSTNSLVALGGREVQLPHCNRFSHQGGGRQISGRSGTAGP